MHSVWPTPWLHQGFYHYGLGRAGSGLFVRAIDKEVPRCGHGYEWLCTEAVAEELPEVARTIAQLTGSMHPCGCDPEAGLCEHADLWDAMTWLCFEKKHSHCAGLASGPEYYCACVCHRLYGKGARCDTLLTSAQPSES